jgi:sialic acid synthase SpsE
MTPVKILNKTISDASPLFIVTETGTTCNGDLNTALKMVDAAKAAGADAIKFMIIGPEFFMSDKSVTYEYEWKGGKKSENMFDMFKRLTFSETDWMKIRDYCAFKDIIFFATVDYIPGVDLAEKLQVPAYKISSWDAANYPLIRKMAHTGKPLILDTGPITHPELDNTLEVIYKEGNSLVILLHCSHSKDDSGVNLYSIPFLKSVFKVPIGYSADSADYVPDIAAVTLGANIIEKRLTLDRSFPGHHHLKALEPNEYKDYIDMIRRVKNLLGEYGVKPSPEDLRQKAMYYVSITADCDIPQGTVITENMLACKRPGTGIAPEFLDIIIGRTARRDIKNNQQFDWNAI